MRFTRQLCIGSVVALAAAAGHGQNVSDREASVSAFRQIASVMRSARCMNCHTSSEFPRQGERGRRHDQLVARGPDGHGSAPMLCIACHQDGNSADGYVPGAPDWHLAPRAMSWEHARGDRDLCLGLLDKKRNGNRLAKGIVIHMINDPLVQWAWAPGARRTPPPIGQEEFHALLQRWEATGAACPQSD
jgi:hypothetical protein